MRSFLCLIGPFYFLKFIYIDQFDTYQCFFFQELVVTSPNERNWRGIFIALLVIVAVLGLILFSIVLVSPPEEGPRNKGVKPTLEDIILKLPEPAKFNGTWISGRNHCTHSFYQKV